MIHRCHETVSRIELFTLYLLRIMRIVMIFVFPSEVCDPRGRDVVPISRIVSKNTKREMQILQNYRKIHKLIRNWLPPTGRVF